MNKKPSKYLTKPAHWDLFVNDQSGISVDLKLMINLMNMTGVYRLNSLDDLWLLCYRYYIIYGMYISQELLLLDEICFRTHYGYYQKDTDFGRFFFETLKNGTQANVLSSELPLFIGVRSKNKSNSSNKKFEAKLILKATGFWMNKDGLVLFPGTPRNRKLRKRLLKGKSLSKKRKIEAQKWANLVTKYL
jgi:hypothetical protein